ncbi:recombinase family protein [Photobacterium sp. J15]|uniref:recombinase family protein n=1 Tax=Photobacterium sp. J15 TaxID=265901 RepID=UPI0007E49317|nr:recombinase family protein [Photobacterium sp. J15]
MAAQVYSYRRFSSHQQKHGGSIERQSDYAKQVAEEHALRLNEDLVMTDEGLSAFHAEHVSRGALGIFIRAVDEGLVDEGSILIVESLDRLSREMPLEALNQFNVLINKGITVITANDGQVYNTSTIAKDPTKLFLSIAVMIRAHDESLTKQKRSVAYVKQQIRKFEQEGKGDVAGTTPFWISRTKKGFELNERAEIAKRIVELYLDYKGLNTISRELADMDIPSPQKGNNRWGISTIRTVLDNKALYGVKHFKLRYLKDGRNLDEEYDLENYYPALISKDDYILIQERKKKKATSRESYGEVTYLLSAYGKGRSICSRCGHAVGSQLQKQVNRKGEYTQSVLRLHCMKHKESMDCCKSFKAGHMEEAFIKSICNQLDGRFLTSSADKQREAEILRAKISEADERIANIIDTLITVKQVDTKKRLQGALMEAEEEKHKLEKQASAIKTNTMSMEEFNKLELLGKKAVDIRNNEERKLLKQMLLQTVERLIINFETNSLSAYFYSGSHLSLNYDQKSESYKTVIFHKTKQRAREL